MGLIVILYIGFSALLLIVASELDARAAKDESEDDG